MKALPADQKLQSTRKFALILAIAATIAAALPMLAVLLSAPSGESYIGSVYNTDDHMVYAAWMRQAMDGQLFFDNRFTTDAQPGLTVNLYYFVLGLIAKVIGIAAATNLSRLAFTFLFVWLLYRLVRKIGWDVHATKFAILLPIIAGGVGFLVWHTFGVVLVKESPLGPLLLGRLPVDVWQPEVLVFPSMLSNGLFMVSLCLILTIFLAVLQAKESKKAIALGAVAMLVLMNIHSYDVLLVTLTLVGFLVAAIVQKQVTGRWLLGAVIIGLGAIPAALWFVYVLRNDPVFQARAATETFSPNFRQVLFGLIFPVALGFTGLLMRPSPTPEIKTRRLIGVGLVAATYLGLFVAASNHLQPEFFLSMPVWLVLFGVTLAAVGLLSDESPVLNLFIAWALVGMIAIYFPAMFQRKLAMGLAIPWSVLGAYGLAAMLRNQERSARNLVAALAIVLCGASSVRWAFREIQLATGNVSNTSLHPVYLSSNVQRILSYLDKQEGKKVVVAMPGIWAPAFSEGKQEEVRTTDLDPFIPDLNPIISGFTGAYTYAGHWSETPEYDRRRNEVLGLFLAQTEPETRQRVLAEIGADYVVAPNPDSLPDAGLYDFRQLGEVVADGGRFLLIKIRKDSG